jgi:hypothetical protein
MQDPSISNGRDSVHFAGPTCPRIRGAGRIKPPSWELEVAEDQLGKAVERDVLPRNAA